MNKSPRTSPRTSSSSSRTALLVIDLQSGVVADCHDVPGVISRVSTLVTRAREADAPVIWVQHEDPGLIRDSLEWQWASGLPKPLEGEVRIYKKYPDSFTVPKLDEELRARGIRHLVITGAQTDQCIRSTAHAAAVRGYSVTVPRDTHTTEDCEFDGVKTSAKQIMSNANAYFDGGEYAPGVKKSNVSHDKVDFNA